MDAGTAGEMPAVLFIQANTGMPEGLRVSE